MKVYWTTEDLAERLQVSVSWVYDRTRKTCLNRIPHLKLGKYIRFDPEGEEFRAWLDSHKINAVVGSSPQRRLQVVENKGQLCGLTTNLPQ